MLAGTAVPGGVLAVGVGVGDGADADGLEEAGTDADGVVGAGSLPLVHAARRRAEARTVNERWRRTPAAYVVALLWWSPAEDGGQLGGQDERVEGLVQDPGHRE